MAALCNSCQSLCSSKHVIDVLCSADGYRAHKTVGTILQSAEEGCPFCSMLVDSSYTNFPNFEKVLTRPAYKVKISGQLGKKEKLEKLQFCVDLSTGQDGGEWWREFMAFRVRVGPVTAVDVDRRLRFDSPAVVEIVRRWIGDCAKHKKCSSKTEPKLPRRVLDIGIRSGEDIQLLESKGLRGRYAILSYCWGGEQVTVTNKTTISSHYQQLGISSLSQTIQDAISVARNAGLRYLWVDALCIVQNDSDDKMLEISKMHDYYKKSSLTVIAASAARADEGFLRRPVLTSCGLPYMTLQGETIATISHKTIDPEEEPSGELRQGIHDVAAKIRNPIFNRAWTFEERLLSRTRIQYGLNQIEWECQSSFAIIRQSLDGEVVVLEDSVVAKEQDPPEFNYFATNYTPSIETIVASWAQAVEVYTSRHLTKPQDKLPAIGAIAHEFQRGSGDTYLAGLWKETLHMELLWCFDPEHTESYAPEIAAVSFDRAPSWSWASLDGPVKAGKIFGKYEKEAVLCAYHIDPKSPKAPFGQVKSGGYLEFDACVKQVPALQGSALEDVENYRFPHYDKLDEEDHVKFDLEPEENWDTCDAWLLWLCTKDFEEEWGNKPVAVADSNDARKTEDQDEQQSSEGSESERCEPCFDEAVGLIVVPTGDAYSYHFKRIGVFSGVPPSWFASTPKFRIRLL